MTLCVVAPICVTRPFIAPPPTFNTHCPIYGTVYTLLLGIGIAVSSTRARVVVRPSEGSLFPFPPRSSPTAMANTPLCIRRASIQHTPARDTRLQAIRNVLPD